MAFLQQCVASGCPPRGTRSSTPTDAVSDAVSDAVRSTTATRTTWSSSTTGTGIAGSAPRTAWTANSARRWRRGSRWIARLLQRRCRVAVQIRIPVTAAITITAIAVAYYDAELPHQLGVVGKESPSFSQPTSPGSCRVMIVPSCLGFKHVNRCCRRQGH